MSETEDAAVNDRSLAKGLIAGLVGGLAGVLAQTLTERLLSPHTDPVPEPVAGSIAGHKPVPAKSVVDQTIRWGFGAVVGAGYGAIAEFYPEATVKHGASFGMALQGLTHGNALAASGLAAEAAEQIAPERTGEIASYVAYGVTTEMVRGFVRKRL
jgi:putative membrane protein